MVQLSLGPVDGFVSQNLGDRQPSVCSTLIAMVLTGSAATRPRGS